MHTPHTQGESVLRSMRICLKLHDLPANIAVQSLRKWFQFTAQTVSVKTPCTLCFYPIEYNDAEEVDRIYLLSPT